MRDTHTRLKHRLQSLCMRLLTVLLLKFMRKKDGHFTMFTLYTLFSVFACDFHVSHCECGINHSLTLGGLLQSVSVCVSFRPSVCPSGNRGISERETWTYYQVGGMHGKIRFWSGEGRGNRRNGGLPR